ncbi:MAG: hypothetical protein JWR12_2211 [Mucilaginibacter sp.]|nr:hypothetical protein [Mucilaginibacter sp.]
MISGCEDRELDGNPEVYRAHGLRFAMVNVKTLSLIKPLAFKARYLAHLVFDAQLLAQMLVGVK